MTIKQARRILGKESEKYSDKEIMDSIDTATLFKDIFFEKMREMKPEEIKTLKNNTR